jgi:hypothetical protein
MKQLRIIGAVLGAIVVLSAIASATASAAAPEFSAGAAGTKFTGKSGAGTLSTKAKGTVSCTADTVTGELTGTTKKQGKATVKFTGCTAFGIFGATSLGTGHSSGEIEVEGELELCYINKTTKEVGVLTKVIKPAHFEVAGKLLVVTGDQVGVITPINTKTKNYTIKYKQASGVPSPKGCEGLTETLLTAENGGTAEGSAEETEEKTEFATEQTLIA